MHDIRPVIETLKSTMLHKLGNGVDLNFQHGSRINVPSINTDRRESALLVLICRFKIQANAKQVMRHYE